MMDWSEGLVFQLVRRQRVHDVCTGRSKKIQHPIVLPIRPRRPQLGDYSQYSPEHFLSIRDRIFRDEHGAMHILLGNWKNAVAHPAWHKRVRRKTAGFRSALVIFPGGDFNRRALCVERVEDSSIGLPRHSKIFRLSMLPNAQTRFRSTKGKRFNSESLINWRSNQQLFLV